MKKQSFKLLGPLLATFSLIICTISYMARIFYVYDADFKALMNPASSRIFSLSNDGLFFAFLLALVAFSLLAITIILETKESKVLTTKKIQKSTRAILVSAAVLTVTITSGVTPFYNTNKTRAESVSEKVEIILKNDVDVEFGTATGSPMTVPVAVTNKKPAIADYIIIIDAFDKNGFRLAQDSIYVTDIKVGETKEYTIFSSSYAKLSPKQFETATLKINDITSR